MHPPQWDDNNEQNTDEYKNRIFEYLTRLLARNTSRPATIIRSMPVWPGFCASATIHAVHCVLGCVSHFWHNACRFAGAPVTERTEKKLETHADTEHTIYIYIHIYSVERLTLASSFSPVPANQQTWTGNVVSSFHRKTEMQSSSRSRSFHIPPASIKHINTVKTEYRRNKNRVQIVYVSV